MATAKRIWHPGACYHITVRGNRKQVIFNEDKDYKVYLNMLKGNLEFYKEYEYEILSYCLMSNHVHLQLISNLKEPGTFMRRLNSMYANYYNEKYNFVGHLFQERYHSEYIATLLYMIEVSRYIHLNPVKSKIAEVPEKYIWSSYNEYIGKAESQFVQTENILRYFKLDCKSKEDVYKRYVYIKLKSILLEKKNFLLKNYEDKTLDTFYSELSNLYKKSSPEEREYC